MISPTSAATAAAVRAGTHWTLTHDGAILHLMRLGSWTSSPGYFDAFCRTSPSPGDFLLNIIPAAGLYAWIYDETGRSVLAAIVFHFMENFTSEFFGLAEAVRAWRRLRRGGLTFAVVIGLGRAG